MTSALYAEKLAWFKDHEKPEAVLILADDPQMIRLAVAWTSTTVKRAPELSPLPGESEGEAWDWLWRNAVYSRTELAAKSGLSEPSLERCLWPLAGNRLLYPDGTASSFAQRYLRERVLRLFEAGARKEARQRA